MNKKNTTNISKAINFLAVVGFFYSVSANAIVVRHDVESKQYLANEMKYPAIFPLFDDGIIKECVATLIDKEWAITAAHCTILMFNQNLEKNPHEVKISGVKNNVTNIFIPKQYGSLNPIYNESGDLIDIQGIEDESFDVALLKLGEAVTHVASLPLYKKTDEIGKEIIILGWGDFGKGDLGISSSQPINDGAFRFANNRISEVEGNFFIFNFDSPNSKEVLPFEGVAGPGDSGGPALIKNGNKLELIGVSSGGGYSDGSVTDGYNDGRYGWIEYYIRTSKVLDWIYGVIKAND